MQSLNVDAANRFKSLDDIYYFGGQNGHSRRAALPHDKNTGVSAGNAPSNLANPRRSEIDFLPGDTIGFAGNHWNGYSMGTNSRTGQKGLFPTYKTEDIIPVVEFPTYPQVPLDDPGKRVEPSE
jgi:glycoprotein 6-alpha-L-fucosyltransferase